MLQNVTNESVLTTWHVDTGQQKGIKFVKQRIP